jgi:hypothetical protein
VEGTAAAGAAAGASFQGQQELSKDVLVRLLGVKADLALLAIMCSGNDYLPAVKDDIRLDALWARWAARTADLLLQGQQPYCCCLSAGAVLQHSTQ